MKTADSMISVARFIGQYASYMMGCGVHTSRVIRCSRRIGEALGCRVKIGMIQKSIVLTLTDHEGKGTYNEVFDISVFPISFEHNAKLSALSWEAYDKHLSLEEVEERYHNILSAPRLDPLFTLILVGIANASFCHLFGGDWFSMGIVFSATVVGFFLKQQLQKRAVNHFLIFIICAFVASLCAATSLVFDTTSEIALATSVLFLIPGVPLINGVIDVVEGYVTTGFARLVEALLLVICISVGLALTLFLFKNSLL